VLTSSRLDRWIRGTGTFLVRSRSIPCLAQVIASAEAEPVVVLANRG
jgi:hypothetical protein